jgi:preprotein translocase subunit SecD
MKLSSLVVLVWVAGAALGACGHGLVQTVAFESASPSAALDGPHVVQRLERLDVDAALRARGPSAFEVDLELDEELVPSLPAWLDVITRPGRLRVLAVTGGVDGGRMTAVYTTREEAAAAATGAGAMVFTSTRADGGEVQVQHAVVQVDAAPLVDVSDVVGADLDEDEQGQTIVSVRLTDDAHERFARWTEAHVGQRVALVMDDDIVAVPVINARVDEDLVLTPPEWDEAPARAGASVDARRRAQAWRAALDGQALRGAWTWKADAPPRPAP